MEANETEISFERKTVENCYISEMRTIQPKIPALLERLSSILDWKFPKCKRECLGEQ